MEESKNSKEATALVYEQVGDCCYDENYGMPVLHYLGLPWLPPATRNFVDKVQCFPLDPTDVIVVAFPKSGTNWLQIMLANFYDDWGTCAITPHKRVPSLDIDVPGVGFEGYPSCINAVSPRLMKSHLLASHFPKPWKAARSKVVYITRNPKDICVSYYHQVFNAGMGLPKDFDAWVDRFCWNRVVWGGWLENVLGWHKYGENDGVLHVTYEGLLSNPVEEMRRVVTFLDKPLTEERFLEVINDASFDNMKSSGLIDQINAGHTNEKFLRKGKVGGWKETLTAAQSLKIDDVIVRPLEQAGIFLQYE